MNQTLNPVSIKFVRTPDMLLWIEVEVRSKLKPSSILIGRIDVRTIQSQVDIKYKIEVLGGALAENIAERLKDPLINPAEIARLAGKEWLDLLKKPEAEIIPKVPNATE